MASCSPVTTYCNHIFNQLIKAREDGNDFINLGVVEGIFQVFYRDSSD